MFYSIYVVVCIICDEIGFVKLATEFAGSVSFSLIIKLFGIVEKTTNPEVLGLYH